MSVYAMGASISLISSRVDLEQADDRRSNKRDAVVYFRNQNRTHFGYDRAFLQSFAWLGTLFTTLVCVRL